MKRILIFGCGGPAGINLVRCIRMSGLPLEIVGTDASKFRLQLPDIDIRIHSPILATEKGYAVQSKRIVDEYNPDLVMAQPDAEVSALSDNGGYGRPIAIPSNAAIYTCHNKYLTYLALKWSVSVPKTIRTEFLEGDSFSKLKGGEKNVWLRSRYGAGSHAAAPVSTLEEMKAWVNYCVNHKGTNPSDFIASEYLPGNDYAWQGVYWDGKLLASASRQRVEYAAAGLSPSGQSSSASVAVSTIEPIVESTARAAVAEVDRPHGVFGVDMKCRADGTPCVTEINAGRFYTTCNFHAECGINLPAVLISAAMGFDPVNTITPTSGDVWVRSMDATPMLIRA